MVILSVFLQGFLVCHQPTGFWACCQGSSVDYDLLYHVFIKCFNHTGLSCTQCFMSIVLSNCYHSYHVTKWHTLSHVVGVPVSCLTLTPTTAICSYFMYDLHISIVLVMYSFHIINYQCLQYLTYNCIFFKNKIIFSIFCKLFGRPCITVY